MFGWSIRKLTAFLMVFSITVSPLLGQSELGTTLKRHYKLRSVSCHTCHLKEEEEKTRDALTDFGKISAKLVEGKMVTERLNAVEGGEKEDKEAVEDAIKDEFAEALKKLEEMQAPSGKTYAEAIQAGEIEGIKTRN